MTGFRGTDEQLDREIAQVERIARLRLARAAAEMRELDRDLKELRRVRARRKADASVPAASESVAPVVA
ncbi:MAG TPA: hypothetical protein VML53_01105 [Thermoplasmata archaeon]|nr:hypothetical protein [Thermoplasmata archaeon]